MLVVSCLVRIVEWSRVGARNLNSTPIKPSGSQRSSDRAALPYLPAPGKLYGEGNSEEDWSLRPQKAV